MVRLTHLANSSMAHCLSLDLEVGVKDGRIHALAGVRADTGECLTLSVTRRNLANALTRLHELADGAGFLLGHNPIDFDLHHLRATNPNLRLLTLPAVDTLRLNPLAFPRNPYHHLVKRYQDGQRRHSRRNDPELDARLTLELFGDQLEAFRDAPEGLLTAWPGLLPPMTPTPSTIHEFPMFSLNRACFWGNMMLGTIDL